MECQVFLPHIERLITDQCGYACDPTGLPDNDQWLTGKTGSFEIAGPIKPGGLDREILNRPWVVSLVHIRRIGAACVSSRNHLFEIVNASSLGIGVRHLCEFQDCGNVLAIL